MPRNETSHTHQSGDMVVMSQEDIQQKIYTVRGAQVMLDRDLAPLYQVTTGRLNEAVKRNIDRFPQDFMFQLNKEEWESLKSQIAISNASNSLLKSQIAISKAGRGGDRKLPNVFTEEGVSQLSGVLKSNVAVQMSIRITRAFVAMRKYITSNAGLFQRIEQLESFKIETQKDIKTIGERFDQIMNRLDDGSLKTKTGIFFDGQMFDAFVLVEELIQKATKRIVLIDDYITASLLQRFHRRNVGVSLDCYVKSRFNTRDLQDAFTQYNAQYPSQITNIHTFEHSHDRWLIIDDTVYHFGASLKDLGKRWFSVDIITENTADDLISRL